MDAADAETGESDGRVDGEDEDGVDETVGQDETGEEIESSLPFEAGNSGRVSISMQA